MAPVQIMMRLKAAHDALGKHDSLDGLSFGVRLGIPALRLVTQPHHAQYVVYAVPDDVAARFDCELRLSPGSAAKVSRVYGNFYASVFRVGGAAGTTVALLWAKEKDYWRIVSWKTDADEEDDKTPPPDAAPDVTIVKVKADATLVQAAKGFLDSWLVRKDYDAAFRYLSAESYGCYNESRSPGAPAANSPADAGRLIRAGLERVGNTAGKASLASLVTAAEPVHPAVRVMEHSASHTFTLVSYPDGLGELAGCATAVSSVVKSDLPPEYGKVFGMNIRFITAAGEAPVMRTLWMKDASTWRIAAYYIEYP
jgi:hypothetical protein